MTLACRPAAMPSMPVVVDSGYPSRLVQNSDQRLDDTPPWSNSFVLIGEQMSKMSILAVEDVTNARDRVALNSLVSIDSMSPNA